MRPSQAGYDGVDVDAEPDKISADQFVEVTELTKSLGLKVPALICAWGAWHAGEERNLASTDEAIRTPTVDYTKKGIDLSATFGDPPLLEIDAVLFQLEYPQCSIPRHVLRLFELGTGVSVGLLEMAGDQFLLRS